jgi:catechol-2,3-dioxygenase
MRVNHLHLMVPDVPAASGFFEKYFDLRKSGGNAGLTVLQDESGFVLTLMKWNSRSVGAYPENFPTFDLSRPAWRPPALRTR